ncbi:hypothetical protein LCGC14_1461670 [marine sediment metagenome]|uniref:Uncharacterized protein n=1 Tax=marine sediment metagenome TaxID=412755 RepID=A0A0F9K102_9ZZZZ
MSDEALRLPTVTCSRCEQVYYVRDDDSTCPHRCFHELCIRRTAAREAVLVETARSLLDALGRPRVASGLRTGRQEVMLRIGNLHAALSGEEKE